MRCSISSSVRGEYFVTACMCAHASSIASIALSGRMRSVDVPVGELHRRAERLVGDEHVVMALEPLLARVEDLERLELAELADDDLLKAALERRIALDPLARTPRSSSRR